MKTFKEWLKEKSYMGNEGEEVQIKKEGKGEKTIYRLINKKGDMIDMFFDTEIDARNYAKKKKLKIKG